MSALHPGAASLLLEAARTAREVEEFPVAIGQKVWVGFKGMHALPTPISSLRLLAHTDAAFAELSGSLLVRELGERMRIEPVRVDRNISHESSLRGMPVLALQRPDDLSEPLELLYEGARQVLILLPGNRRPERMLILVEPSAVGRDATLAAVASLARHLTIDVTMLVHVDEKSGRGARYRELLDLRNRSLRSHGLDIRTETYQGRLLDAVAARQPSSGQVLLVLGLVSPTNDKRLVGEVKEVLQKSPPAALVLVSGRAENSLHKTAPVSTQAAASAR